MTDEPEAVNETAKEARAKETAAIRRRWITLGEGIAVLAVTISALTLYINWSDKQETRAEKAAEKTAEKAAEKVAEEAAGGRFAAGDKRDFRSIFRGFLHPGPPMLRTGDIAPRGPQNRVFRYARKRYFRSGNAKKSISGAHRKTRFRGPIGAISP